MALERTRRSARASPALRAGRLADVDQGSRPGNSTPQLRSLSAVSTHRLIPYPRAAVFQTSANVVRDGAEADQRDLRGVAALRSATHRARHSSAVRHIDCRGCYEAGEVIGVQTE